MDRIIDYTIIAAYLMLVMVIGVLSGRKNNNQEDFLLAGRSMPWFPIAFSIAATMISANTFIGAPGWAYTSGISPYMTNIMVPLAVFIAIYITVPVFYNLKVTSIYEYIDKRFGKYASILTVIQFFINSIIQVSSMVYIPSLIIMTITGLQLYYIVPVVVLISIAYTIIGGIRAVIWTDFMQMIVVWASSIIVVVLALTKMDISIFDSISSAADAGQFDVFDFSINFKSSTAFWVASIGGFFMWVRYFCFDQVQVQRILTAKSINATKRSLCLSAFLMNAIFLLMLFAGVILKQFYGDRVFDNQNLVMIDYILNHLPVGVVGLAIAGTLASAMSSVDSLLNSLTTVFIKDIYEVYFTKKESSLKTTVTVACAFGVVIIGFVIIGFSSSVSSVIEVVGTYISYFSGPACAVFILGLLTKRANDKGVSLGFIVGLIMAIVVSRTFQTTWLVNPAVGAISALVVGYLASISIFKQPSNTVEYTAYEKSESVSKSSLPFKLDKYAIITLAIFFAQFIILSIL